MRFNFHSNLEGRHANLSPSQYHWINYDEDKLVETQLKKMAARRGDELHALAHNLIRLREPLPRKDRTLNLYVNDAIGYKLSPEQPLYYSDNCFGTADAIGFKRNKLRVHDLKTGVSPTSEHQLEVYAALYCLEYDTNPMDIEIELRIYQNDEVRVYIADPVDIRNIMEKIKFFDKRIEALREEAMQ